MTKKNGYNSKFYVITQTHTKVGKSVVEKETNQLMFEETCAFLSPFMEAA